MTFICNLWLACIALGVRVAWSWEHSDADALKTTLAAHDVALVACK